MHFHWFQDDDISDNDSGAYNLSLCLEYEKKICGHVASRPVMATQLAINWQWIMSYQGIKSGELTEDPHSEAASPLDNNRIGRIPSRYCHFVGTYHFLLQCILSFFLKVKCFFFRLFLSIPSLSIFLTWRDLLIICNCFIGEFYQDRLKERFMVWWNLLVLLLTWCA